MLFLSLGQGTLNSQLLIVNWMMYPPTLQPIRSRFIPRKRLLNGTIGRSSDLSCFASFPIGLPPISGLFAKDTSVVSCFKFQVSGFKFQVSSFKFQETSYSTTRCGLTAAGLLRILTVFPFESGRYSWYLLFVIQNCAQRYYFFMNYARNWEIFYFIRIHLAISKKNRIFAQRNETQYWLAQLQFIIALCC